MSDFCAPIWTQTTLLGEVNSVKFRGSPTDGAYAFTTYALPLPDEDSDGIETALDPCPLTPNAAGWDPRGPLTQDPGDQDGDGLPDDCDPQPMAQSTCHAANGVSNSDEDCDGWINRGDNCPLVSNPGQEDTELDGIGNACDPNPVVPVGTTPATCLVNNVTIGAGGPAPADPQTMVPCPEFVPAPHNGDVDCDFDVDLLDLIAWMYDWAGIADVPCPLGLPPGCDVSGADISYGMSRLLLHIADSNHPVTGCPVP
jgi:hypothetical protein